MPTIQSIAFSGSGFPTDEGQRLADRILSNGDVELSDLEIDLSSCEPALLISAFFNAFLQRIHVVRPDRLTAVRNVQWKLKFDFQRKNAETWMSAFKPYDATKLLSTNIVLLNLIRPMRFFCIHRSHTDRSYRASSSKLCGSFLRQPRVYGSV